MAGEESRGPEEVGQLVAICENQGLTYDVRQETVVPINLDGEPAFVVRFQEKGTIVECFPVDESTTAREDYQRLMNYFDEHSYELI